MPLSLATPKQLGVTPPPRWPVWTLSAAVLLSLVLMAMQSWNDRIELDRATAHNVRNVATVLGGTANQHFRLLADALRGMDGLAAAGAGRNAAGATDALLALRDALDHALPGSELAILSPDGAVLLASDAQLPNQLPRLPALLGQARRGGGTSIENALHGPAWVTVKPHLDAGGKLAAVLLASVPGSSMGRQAAGLTLLPLSAITLLDEARRPLAQWPAGPAALPGTPFPVGAPLPGRFQSGFQDSPLDGQQRLAAEVPLQLAWAGPGQRWLLQYGQGTGDYRRAWNSSVLFNLMISALLLVMLFGHLRAYHRRRAQVARADGTMQLLGQVLNTLPTPLALVEQDGAIAVGNSALLERFGALGGPGQPVARLFADGADWHALTAAGKADALAMCCRRGDMVAQAHCTALQARAARYWLLSLVDVTDQQQRMSALVGAAMRDPLTGLANRRGYAEGAAAALAASAAHGAPLALLALDLDHFKRVNDTHGHAAGDQVLVTVARLIGGAMRDGDLAARLGGEEFTLLLPGADAAQAHAVAERVRLAIAATPIKIDSGAVLTQTVSIGISLLLPGETALEAAQERADAALYRAKELGRNRTVAA